MSAIYFLKITTIKRTLTLFIRRLHTAYTCCIIPSLELLISMHNLQLTLVCRLVAWWENATRGCPKIPHAPCGCVQLQITTPNYIASQLLQKRSDLSLHFHTLNEKLWFWHTSCWFCCVAVLCTNKLGSDLKMLNALLDCIEIGFLLMTRKQN